jgi:hypothetical protein
MRLFEFAGDDGTLEKFVTVLKNFAGRGASKKEPVKLNWAGLDRISKGTGMEITADYETFKAMYDASPLLQSVVKNFNADGIELNVPGAPDAEKAAPQGGEKTSQDAVDKMAASAAPQQLAAQA